jgi:hypothetical protein
VSTTQSLADALLTGRGIERPFRCHVHDDSNASASVNTQTGLWICYACGAAGKADDSATTPDCDTLLAYLKGDTPARVYAESWLDMFDIDHASREWSARFGEDTANHFRCGTHPISGYPTYPIRDRNGQVLGVVTRQPDGDPKYKYPFGVSTSRTLFGDLRPSPVVVLVEGASDVMALHQSGIPGDWTVLGCYGAGLHAPQVQIVADLAPRVVVTAFDSDAAGIAAAGRTAEHLASVARVINHSWGSFNDPGDMHHTGRIDAIRDTLAKENH